MKFRISSALLISLVWLPFYLSAQYNPDLFKATYSLGKEFYSRHDITKLPDPGGIDSRKSKQLQKRFKESNDYIIDRFLNSGIVISSSKANDYINRVADKLLAANPSLRKEVKFYIVYTSEVNAFTFPNGMIFINMGLLAHLDNEAQLAFILSHEVAHYMRKHSFKRYELRNSDSIDLNESEVLQVVLSKFSREQELEADADGMKIYKESGYASTEVKSSFEMLMSAEFPIENRAIPRSAFEGKYLLIPPSYYSDSAIASDVVVEESDTIATHPNIGKRIDAAQKFFGTFSTAGSKFLISESEFKQLKGAARYELSLVFIQERNLMSSLYNTEVLLLNDPGNEYLYECKVKALYYLSHNINESGASGIIRYPRKIKGEIRKFHQLFKKASKEEMNAICLRLSWDIYKKYSSNKAIKAYTNAITRSFELNVSNKLTYFKPASKFNADSILAEYKKDTVAVKIKKFSRSMTVKTGIFKVKTSFASFSMGDYLEDKEFSEVFNRISDEVQPILNKLNEDEEEEETITRNQKKKKGKQEKSDEEVEKDFKSDKILILDVSSLVADARSKDMVKFRDIQDQQLKLVHFLKQTAALNNVDIELFNPVSLKSTDTALFNDRSTLFRWRNLRLANSKLDQLIPSEFEDVNLLVEKYGTPYVAVVNTVSYVSDLSEGCSAGLTTIYTIFHPVLFGYLVYKSLFKYRACAIEIPVYDLRTGEIVYTFEAYYTIQDKDDIYKAQFYKFFSSIKK